ncbi:MAG: hypothetical protein WCQ86_07525, partial [Bacteroidaceae bacterium]
MRDNIKANVFGKGKKLKKTLIIERCLKVITSVSVGVWTVDALFPALAQKWFLGLNKRWAISSIGL